MIKRRFLLKIFIKDPIYSVKAELENVALLVPYEFCIPSLNQSLNLFINADTINQTGFYGQ